MNTNSKLNPKTPIALKLSKLPIKTKKLILPFDITAFLLKHKLTKTHSQIQIYNHSIHHNSNSNSTNNITNYYLMNNNSTKCNIYHSFSPQWSDVITSNKSSYQKPPKSLVQISNPHLGRRIKNKSLDKEKPANLSMFESYENWLNKKVDSLYLPLVPRNKPKKRKNNSLLCHSCSQQDIEKARFTNKFILQKISETLLKRQVNSHVISMP